MSPPRRMTSAAEAKSQWLDKTRFAPANRRRLSPAALRTFLAIADLWGLTEEQRLLVLGYPSRSTYHNWAKQAREHGSFTLDVDILTRISAMLGIHQALGILFPTERLGVEWLRTPHDAIVFGGQPPLALVTSGSQDGLLAVRRFFGRRAWRHLHAAQRGRSGVRALRRFRTRLPVTLFGFRTATGLSSYSLAIPADWAVRFGCDRRRLGGRVGACRLDQ